MTKWPRYCELLLGLWLVASGWVVEYPERINYQWVSAGSGITVVILDLLSITLYKRYAYLLILPVAAGLIAFSFWMAPAEAQGTQNLITVALLLLILAVLPTEATLPPPSWRGVDRR
jgi:hypothetical protein